MRRSLVLVSVIVIAVVVVGVWPTIPKGFARKTSVVTWPCAPISYSIDGDEAFATSVRQVVQQVSDITGRPFVEVPDGSVQIRLYWPDGAMSWNGWTKLRNDGSNYTKAIVYINPTGSTQGSTLRLGVIRHEMGHVMGMAHTDLYDSIMYGRYMHLVDYSPYDIQGLHYLGACVN